MFVYGKGLWGVTNSGRAMVFLPRFWSRWRSRGEKSAMIGERQFLMDWSEWANTNRKVIQRFVILLLVFWVGLHWLFACWYKFWLVFWTEYKCNLFYEARFKSKEELACFSAVVYCIPLERHNLMWRIRWSWVLKHFSSEHCSSTELLCKGKIWILRSGKGTMTIFRNRGCRNALSGRNKCWYAWLSICTIRFSLPILSSVYGFSHLNPDVSAAKE